MSEAHRFTAESLAALPEKDGFRQRGMDMTRLETFTDAAFAFAVTLLVVGGGDSIPQNFDELVQAMKQVPAFAASFANIMLFWFAHHVWSRRYGLEDTKSIVFSMLLIFVVLIYVYPLKAIYSGAIDFFSGGHLDSYFKLNSLADLRILFVIFGAFYCALSGVIVLLNRHALAKKETLKLNELELFDTVTETRFWTINMIVPFISASLALLLPDGLVVVAGLFYCVFGVVLPWYAIRRGKIRDGLKGH